ncbi:uncharacterized [Tachysurus ichikawai]
MVLVDSQETTVASEGRSAHRHATQAAICDKSSVPLSKAAQLAPPRSVWHVANTSLPSHISILAGLQTRLFCDCGVL